jgi:predicted kinase
MMARLVYTCGYPFSGKSTLARGIAHETGWPMVEVDAFMSADHSSDWRDAYVSAYTELRHHLSAGSPVVFDSVAHTRKHRYRLERVAAQTGAIALGIWLATSEAEADTRRIANRLNPRRLDVPDEGFRMIVDQFEPPDPAENLLVYQPQSDIRTWIESTLRPALNQEVIWI